MSEDHSSLCDLQTTEILSIFVSFRSTDRLKQTQRQVDEVSQTIYEQEELIFLFSVSVVSPYRIITVVVD